MRVLLLSLSFSVMLFAATPVDAAERQTPKGFRKIDAEDGVATWKKGREFVQVIAHGNGASVKLLNGDMIPSDGAGTNFARKTIPAWWKEWKEEEPGASTLVNAQFFNTDNPAKSPLAFSTKIGGIVHVGYGDETEYAGKKLVLRLGERSAAVEPYRDDAGTLYAMEEPDAIVGLKPDAGKAGNVRRARTFVGVNDAGDVLLFVSPAATQRYAYRILAAFGAGRSRIMMLDGGGSTQFVRDGELLIPTARAGKPFVLRPVPLAIGVVAGE
jgi:hypothetical protein